MTRRKFKQKAIFFSLLFFFFRNFSGKGDKCICKNLYEPLHKAGPARCWAGRPGCLSTLSCRGIPMWPGPLPTSAQESRHLLLALLPFPGPSSSRWQGPGTGRVGAWHREEPSPFPMPFRPPRQQLRPTLFNQFCLTR